MKDMTQGGELKHIILFTLPLLLGNVFQQLYNTVDSIVVGQYIGKEALAAVSTCSPMVFLLVAVMTGFTMGAAVAISQYFGAKKLDELRDTVSTIYIFVALLAVVLTGVGLLAARPMLILLQVPKGPVLDYAATYLNIYFGGIITVAAYNTFSAVLRAVGDSKTPLYFLILSTLVNTGLDIYLVGYVGWGVAGAAIATVFAQGLSAILCLIYINLRIPLLRFSLKQIRFNKARFKQIFRLGMPSGIQQTILSFGFLGVQGLVNSFGAVTMAAFGAGMRVDQFVSLPFLSCGMAVATFSGQNMGAGKVERVKTGLYKSVLLVAAISVFAVALLLPFGEKIISLFVSSSDPDFKTIVQQGYDYIFVIGTMSFLMGMMFLTNNWFRGIGDVYFAMSITFVNLSVRVAAAYIMAYSLHLGYRGIWWSLPISWAAALTMGVFRFISGKWRNKAIIAGSAPAQQDVFAE